MKKCIVVIDMQNDFIDGSLGTKEAQAMLPKLTAKLQKATDADFIFTQDTHEADYLTTQEGRNLPVEHCIKPSHGWEIAAPLAPFVKKAKAIIEKPAFGSLELIKAVEGYDEAEIMGLCTDICVISNAMILKAAYPEMKIAVDAACSAGVTPESHVSALAAMKMCQIEIREA
ncbi:MAG: cysteine hydrolase [Selenomonadaceae bacterium]|nr:cysteine hydrolase [Selenomonadaceae bacterium]